MFFSAVAYLLFLLKRIGIYKFPQGVGIFRNMNKIGIYILSEFTNFEANMYIRHNGKKRIIDNDSPIWKDPFLKFQAYWSIGNGSINTPCPTKLSEDLASVTDLKEKRILCIGSKNNYEINLLISKGASRDLIKAIDLYSNIPGIEIMDFHDIKFAEESFDIIFWAGSFAYAKDLQLAANQAIKVVKKPGIIALGDTLLGGATKEVLMKGQPDLEKIINEVPQEIINYTQRLNTVEQIRQYFTKGDQLKTKTILTRLYAPNHANLILLYE